MSAIPTNAGGNSYSTTNWWNSSFWGSASSGVFFAGITNVLGNLISAFSGNQVETQNLNQNNINTGPGLSKYLLPIALVGVVIFAVFKLFKRKR